MTQADRWPGGLPSDTWVPGQVIIDEYVLEFPEDVAPGEYKIAIGLYTAADGLRLTATDLQENLQPDDRFFLPLTVTVEADEK